MHFWNDIICTDIYEVLHQFLVGFVLFIMFISCRGVSVRLLFHLFCKDCKLYSLSVVIYAYCFPTQFPYLLMILSFGRNPTGVISEAEDDCPTGTRSSHTVCVAFVLLNLQCFSVVFVDHCKSLWPLNCMYNKYRLTITPLVS